MQQLEYQDIFQQQPDIQYKKFMPQTISTQTFTTSDTWTCPENVWNVEVSCYGPGGKGGNLDDPYAGGGGGGGGFAYWSSCTVFPGTVYTVTVGLPSISNTSFCGCIATRGSDAGAPTSGDGGTYSGLYTYGYNGGNGGTGAQDSGSGDWTGGGGGGSAGTNGQNGVDGGSGGNPRGGHGGWGDTGSSPGTAPGGGGGGSGGGGTAHAGSAGAAGQVTLKWISETSNKVIMCPKLG